MTTLGLNHILSYKRKAYLKKAQESRNLESKQNAITDIAYKRRFYNLRRGVQNQLQKPIYPEAVQFSIEEQRKLAIKNLRPYTRGNNAAIIASNLGSEVTRFNELFAIFKPRIRGRNNLTPQEFISLWNGFKKQYENIKIDNVSVQQRTPQVTNLLDFGDSKSNDDDDSDLFKALQPLRLLDIEKSPTPSVSRRSSSSLGDIQIVGDTMLEEPKVFEPRNRQDLRSILALLDDKDQLINLGVKKGLPYVPTDLAIDDLIDYLAKSMPVESIELFETDNGWMLPHPKKFPYSKATTPDDLQSIPSSSSSSTGQLGPIPIKIPTPPPVPKRKLSDLPKRNRVPSFLDDIKQVDRSQLRPAAPISKPPSDLSGQDKLHQDLIERINQRRTQVEISDDDNDSVFGDGISRRLKLLKGVRRAGNNHPSIRREIRELQSQQSKSRHY